MRVCQLKVITSIDHRYRTLQDFYADKISHCVPGAHGKILVASLDIYSVKEEDFSAVIALMERVAQVETSEDANRRVAGT